MPRVITVSDDVYEMLKALKGSKSFSEIIRELIKARKGNARIILMFAGQTDIDENAVKEVREAINKWR